MEIAKVVENPTITKELKTRLKFIAKHTDEYDSVFNAIYDDLFNLFPNTTRDSYRTIQISVDSVSELENIYTLAVRCIEKHAKNLITDDEYETWKFVFEVMIAFDEKMIYIMKK